MNKKIIYLVVLAGALFLAGTTLAVSIPNFGPDSLCALLTSIVTQVSTLVATLGTIMIIVAGILYLTSAGSEQRMGTAKKALIYAVVGIAIGLSAAAIVDIVKKGISATGGAC